MIGLLLIAFFLRVWMLNDVPPGLHHDEVIIGQVAKDILRGHFAVYFTAGYGHEPLYHYVVAGLFDAIGANAFVLRLTSAFIAMLGLATTYVLVRRMFSPVVAIGTLAWMAISLWPVFFARVGLRGIMLPLLTTLTAYFLWRALFSRQTLDHRPQTAESSAFNLPMSDSPLESRWAARRHPSSFILPGILLGLSLYTYQASRVFPLIFAGFFVYLFAVRRASKSSSVNLPMPDSPLESQWAAGRQPSSLSWRSVVVFFLSALIVAAPLIIYLTLVNPSAEARVADLSGPLAKLQAGDPSEVISSTLNTLGMFTFRGDAVPIYNVSGRPVFPEIVGAALFVIGLLICLWRWKRPAYALMLIWFFVSLVPAMVTPFSPNFVRSIASWPAPFVFAGVAMSEVTQWVGKRQPVRGNSHPQRGASQSATPQGRFAVRIPQLAMGAFVLILGYNAILTARDYFVQWPASDYVRFWQQATWTQAVRTLNADPSQMPIAASGLSIQDFDPQTFDLLGLRSDLKVKWFDCRNAMLFPQEGTTTRYLTPAYLPCDADLQARFWTGAEPLARPAWPATTETIFTLHALNGQTALAAALNGSALRPLWIGREMFARDHPESDLEPAPSPVALDSLELLGWETDRVTAKPGAVIDLFTYWEMAEPIAGPLKIFVHVTAPDGKIVTQWDELDVNVDTLDARDVFAQRHRLDLPADLPPGPYRLSIGAYRSDNGARLKANFDGQDIDSIVLGGLNVQ